MASGGKRAGIGFLRRLRVLLAGPMLLLLIGVTACQRPAVPQGVTEAAVGQDELDPLWDSALSVLRKHGFTPARQDRALGLIETKPTTSAQWFEFWRQDVADAYDLLDASLHTTQRKVTVRFVRAGGNGAEHRTGEGWSVQVEVDVYRLSRPETQITTASSVLHGFSGSLPTVQGQALASGASKDRWVYLRRDGEMEQRLLHRILAEAGDLYADADA